MSQSIESTSGRDLCWNCQSQPGGEYFCESCVKIQPISKEVDYFFCLGLPRILKINREELEERFYERSRKLHPDFFQQGSDQEKAFSLENSAVLNTAYRTLRDPIKRVEYLLRLEEGKAALIPSKAPGDLLEEILDLQETLQEYKIRKGEKDPETQKLRTQLNEEQQRLESRRKALEEELQGLFGEWDQLESTNPMDRKNNILNRFKEILSNRAYLLTVLRDIKEGLD